MKLCLYSPYVPKHFGGGEKHFFEVAQAAQRAGHQVFIAIPETELARSDEHQASYESYFNVSLKNCTWVSTPLGTNSSFFSKLLWTRQWDGLYYTTDGSLFFSLATHNHLHIQIPFTIPQSSVISRIKLHQWHHKNTNSFFTKNVIEKSWSTTIDTVLEPSVDFKEFEPRVPLSDKKFQIVHIGRFFKQLHSKRQDVLIDLFKKILHKWDSSRGQLHLYLIGGVEDEAYLHQLQKQAEGSPITFVCNATRAQIIAHLRSAKVYWHATGWDIDEEAHPEGVEHFGISTLEAMAAGAIPIVLGKGGQKEILDTATLRELLWYDFDQAVDISLRVLQDDSQAQAYQDACFERLKYYSQEQFNRKVAQMFSAE